MNIHERLRNRPTAFQPQLAEAWAIRRWFEGHPQSRDAYLFYDGRIIDGEVYRRHCGRHHSYAYSLVLMQMDGIPVNVIRRHYERTL